MWNNFLAKIVKCQTPPTVAFDVKWKLPTFAELIFHSETISLSRRANFVKKSTYYGKCFFLALPARISPLANIPTSFAWQASLSICGRGMRTQSRAVREDELCGDVKRESRNGKFAYGEYFCSQLPRASSGRFARKMRTQSRALREDGFDVRMPKRENCKAVLPIWHPQRESNP